MAVVNIIYVIATTFFVTLNVLFCALQIGLIRRRRPWPRFLPLAVAAWCALMLALFFLQIFAPPEWRPILRRWFYFPIAVEMVWNFLFLQLLVLGGILLTLGLRWRRPVRPSAMPTSPADLSRRKFVQLVACGAAPAAALSLGVHGSISASAASTSPSRISRRNSMASPSRTSAISTPESFAVPAGSRSSAMAPMICTPISSRSPATSSTAT